ncbi:uncharacterized protein BJ171DRAFT_516799 [Polychytrium aggregatum]|uniref:uncharacterized protein n=1 Tax=Polychytrium aggregatum TaxID=110093 RepID=UPI0022FDBF05|nr:uncharacterized protein BJ171DRAFT_516799 [Polychytrium aggregatum]KAI9201888.1 hypothetical protein BJ171DRAFT_516799 [Polychytrium aggregatum]
MRQHADLVFVGTLSGSVYSVAAAALAEGLVALDLVYEHPNGSPVTALGYWPPTNTLVSGHRDGSVFDSQSSNCTLVYPAIDNMTSQVLDLKPAPMALSWLALYVDGVVEWQIDAAATSAEARIVKSRALPELVSLDVHPHEQQVAVIDRHGQVFVLNSTDFDLLQSWYLYSPSTSSSSSTLATDNSSDNSSDSSSASNNNDADGGSIDAGNSTEPAAAFVAGASADATTVTSETTTAAAATSTAVAVTITSAPPTAEAVLQTAVIESSDPFGAASVSDNSFAPYPSTSHHERLVYILYQSMQSLIYQWDSVAGNCLASPVSIPSRVASLKFSKRQQLLWIGLENGLVAHLTLPSQC